jgi:RNA polymerase sigma-54 factor
MRQQFGMHQKMQQRMIMTPMLQQAMKILQLSTLELKEWVEKEIMENPVLEEENEEGPETPDKTSLTEAAEPPSTETEQENSLSNPTLEKAREPHQTDVVESLRDGGRFKENTWELFNESQEYSDYGDSEWGGRESSDQGQEKRDFAEASITRAETLAEHLEWQLLLVAKNEKDQALGRVLIGNLDESGYLSDTVEHIGQTQGVSAAEVERVLGILQGFEPAGVGARDLRECLLLQLENKTGELARKAYQVVLSHFEDMEKRRYPVITKALNCSTEVLREILTFISNLEPKPGRSFQDNDTKYITPDVFVRKIEGEYVVVLNDEPVPKLHISPYYRRLLKDKKAMNGKETKKFLENKIQSALWLIKNIEQRRKTIYRVTEAIAKIQQGFLDYGIGALKPLTLRQVADMIGMHESTVSRVTTHKYVQTPRGLFELKFFFTSGLESVDGLDVSSMSVKERIKELVHQESPQKPYSDQKIMQILTEQGLSIARRTIAKYREELRIPSASQRRKI